MRPSERRKVVSAYVRARLRQECAVRGVAAKIARATGFSTAHITNIQKEDRGIGEDFADAIAKYWSMSPAELEAAARAWSREQPPTAAPPERGSDPSAERALAADLARQDGVFPGAIAAVMAEPITPANAALSVLAWARRMKLRELEMSEAVPDESGEMPIKASRRTRKAS